MVSLRPPRITAGLSGSIGMLIAARVAQGIGARLQSFSIWQYSTSRPALCPSQIRRGSNAIAANIVVTTTAPNATAPAPARIDARDSKCTSVASSATTYTSSIDHLPTNSTAR